jgi:probable FeS assembly SUF system protein SufT
MEEVTFARDCDCILIPDGMAIPVGAGTKGWVTQVLGGNFTVQLTNGRLVRVNASDASVIGQVVKASPLDALDPDAPVSQEVVWAQLRTCFDPEIPLDIVELGLVYDVVLVDDGDDTIVEVVMTLTAPGCGMGQVLADDVQAKVGAIPGVAEARVELTFEPPWSPERMSEEGKLELGMLW